MLRKNEGNDGNDASYDILLRRFGMSTLMVVMTPARLLEYKPIREPLPVLLRPEVFLSPPK